MLGDSSASLAVSRFVKQPMVVYDAITRSFTEDNKSGLEKVIEEGQETLSIDGNLGLAYRVLDSLIEHRVRRLTKTYITLSLVDVARIVDLPNASNAEHMLLKLVEQGLISVKIDGSTGKVHFVDAYEASEDQATVADKLSSLSTVRMLESCMEDTIRLSHRLKEIQKEILTSTEYIMKTNSSRGGAGLSSATGASEMMTSFGNEWRSYSSAPMDTSEG